MHLTKQIQVRLQFVIKSLFFLQYLPQALFYSLKRDQEDRDYLRSQVSESSTLPGKLIHVVQIDRGVHVEFEQAKLEIIFLTADLVRVHWSPGLPPVPYAIAQQTWNPVEVSLDAQGDGWRLASDHLSVWIGSDGSLTFSDAEGRTIRQEAPPMRQGDRWTHRALLRVEEHIYGLGERASSLNLRQSPVSQSSTPLQSTHQQPDRTYQMWNYDPGGRYPPGTDPMYICIPVYLGLHEAGSYLTFYENSFRAEFTFAAEAVACFAGGALRYYVAIGTPSHLLDRYTELTGRPSLPARWALGYHQSRWGYRTETTIRQEIKTFQEHQLPISAIHLDIDCQVGHRAFSLDPQRFPNIADFTQELAESDIRLIVINNPGIRYSRQSNLFLEGQILNAFCCYPSGALVVAPVWAGRSAFPDFTNPQVRSWWSRQYAYLLDVGVAGFWHDMNEPAAFVLWGDHSLPQSAQHDFEGRGGDHREAHNIYGLLEAKAAHDSIRRYRPEQRPFIVSRSGWAGLQRYAWTWTGDTICTWESLRQTISTVIGLGLSGIPYSGPDIGGFQGNPSAELYVRWFQMATFLAFYRTHSSTSVSPRSPWTYGEPYLSIIRRFLQLRYQLMPYFYTLAWEAQTGSPMVRPLFWCNPQRQSLWDIDDAFLAGDALLVCPIVEPSAASRQVLLPDGQWYHFWTDAAIDGTTQITSHASLEHIPLFVRAGSVLPMVESDAQTHQQLTLHLYPPTAGTTTYRLFSDAGDGYEEGRLDQFEMVRSSEHELELYWTEQGNYPFPYRSLLLQLHGLSLQQVCVDGQSLDAQSINQQAQTFVCHRFQHIHLQVR